MDFTYFMKSEVRSSYREKDFHTTNLEIDDVIFCIFSVDLNVIAVIFYTP